MLAVWAHPDDEAFLSAGLMMRVLKGGGRVVVVHATKGEAGSQDPERWPPEKMGEIRERELQESLEILGVREHHWLGYVDGTCDAVDDDEAASKLGAIIGDVQPKSVFTFDQTGGTGHPDHMAVSRWTHSAFDSYASSGANLYHATVTPEWAQQWCPVFEPYNVFAPGTPETTPRADLSLSVGLDDEALRLKIRALQAHGSQTDAIFAMFGEESLRASQAEENFVIVATK